MRNLWWGIFLVIFGVLLLLDNLDLISFRDIIHNYWPLILIIWGVSIITRRKTHSHPTEHIPTQQSFTDLLHQSSVFGDVDLRITSQDFKGGSVSTAFGDCYLDLSQAGFSEGNHKLRVNSVFGNTLIVLPKNSAASISSHTIIGELTIFDQQKNGFSIYQYSETPLFQSSTKRLMIIINKVFGNIRVQNTR